MSRWISALPSLLIFQSAPPTPSIEGFLLRLLEQLPLVAVIVWLWVRDSARRDASQQAAEKRYEELVGMVINELKQRPACPLDRGNNA